MTTKNKPGNPVIEVVTLKVNKEKTKKKTPKNKVIKPRRTNRPIEVPRHWLGSSCPLTSYLTAPDIFGPCRVPRPGGVSKTGLAIDRTVFPLVTATGFPIAWIKMAVSFNGNSAQQGQAASATSALGAGTNVSPGNQFPQSGQIDDVNIVAACMTVTYLGAPLNATGELLIGTFSDDSGVVGTSTYNSLYFYPGFLKVPLASLVDNPLRVFMTKNGPAADQFLPVTGFFPDLMRPIVLINGAPIGAIVNVELTRTFEYHTSTASGDVIPYEISESGYTSDLGAFQDVQAKLSALPVQVENAFSEYTREVALGAVGAMMSRSMPSLMQGAIGIGNMARLRMNNRVRNNIEL